MQGRSLVAFLYYHLRSVLVHAELAKCVSYSAVLKGVIASHSPGAHDLTAQSLTKVLSVHRLHFVELDVLTAKRSSPGNACS